MLKIHWMCDTGQRAKESNLILLGWQQPDVSMVILL